MTTTTKRQIENLVTAITVSDKALRESLGIASGMSPPD
jgi:hypothetical protein